MHTGKMIKAALVAKKMKAKDLAQEMGIWEQNVNALIRADDCRVSTLESVSRAFKMKPERFMAKYRVD